MLCVNLKVIRLFFILQIFFIGVVLRADIVVSEIMPNSASSKNAEFVELYNNSDTAVDITGWQISDNNSEENIQIWEMGVDTDLGSHLIYNSLVISSFSYAVILQDNYDPVTYVIPQGTLILRASGRIGSGLNDGSADSAILLDNNNVVVSSCSYLSTTKAVSKERIDYQVTNILSNWQECLNDEGHSLGAISSVISTPDPDPDPDSDSTPQPEQSNIKLIITEIMPDNGDEDWIELYVIEGQGSLLGFTLFFNANDKKILGDIHVETGDYLVLNFAKDFVDENIKNIDGYFNLYTNESGLTATDNSLMVANEFGVYLDSVFYANNDGTWASSNKGHFETLVSTGQWIAQESSEFECFDWQKTSHNSISRFYSQVGIPIDTNTKNDFQVGKITKGVAPVVVVDDFAAECDLKFLNTHFSPYGDYAEKTLRIKYKNQINISLRIKIYDVQGRFIKTLLLLENEELGVVEWDGQDENANIMPVGPYIIYYEFVDKRKGKMKTGKKVIVLGRML